MREKLKKRTKINGRKVVGPSGIEPETPTVSRLRVSTGVKRTTLKKSDVSREKSAVETRFKGLPDDCVPACMRAVSAPIKPSRCDSGVTKKKPIRA